MTLYAWPDAAAFGRVVPKAKLYEHASANRALKEGFVREVEQILWSHKLAPETINLAATDAVAEIQVFRIVQKTAVLDRELLRAIDKAIPFPLIFELSHGERIKLAAAWKRPSEADRTRWVIGDYFETEWLPGETLREPLPVATNLGALYERLLSPLVERQVSGAGSGAATGVAEAPEGYADQITRAEAVSLGARIAQAEAVKAKTREVERIKAQLAREKQFNKRVAINAELRAAKQELEGLIR
ncbi:DUF4391 domain-containing protein [Halochromatium roseum]|uniref:DUF4391 domain-containing protein n=1 Tax=Halochromatium roseum TaxID=391920 RepID=UPI0019139330|nr:DUF4391 domain-containing protein [Halochromatium roseum]MBK5938838.1 methyl-accepting chemotaxis protein [Halochromatium roseum]